MQYEYLYILIQYLHILFLLFYLGSNVVNVKTEVIPCTVTSMMFFDKLLNPKNNIVCNGTDKDGNHTIRQCLEVCKNGMYIANNLKMVNNTICIIYHKIISHFLFFNDILLAFRNIEKRVSFQIFVLDFHFYILYINTRYIPGVCLQSVRPSVSYLSAAIFFIMDKLVSLVSIAYLPQTYIICL